jgi:hypothetical protein
VWEIIFFLRAKHITRCFEGFLEGLRSGQFEGQKGQGPPRKFQRNAPLYVLPQTKNVIPCTFRISQRVRATVRERERERERETEKKVQAMIILNQPGQTEKSTHYT